VETKTSTYILDALEVSKNISEIYFKVNYPFSCHQTALNMYLCLVKLLKYELQIARGSLLQLNVY